MQASDYARHISVLVARREPFVIATVTRTEGSTLAKPGFKILITANGEIAAGTLGGGCPEGPVVEAALEGLRTGEHRVIRIHLVDTQTSVTHSVRETDSNEIWVQTNCGGTLELYLEPMLPAHRLVLIGQGGRDDVEAALVHFGRRLSFEVIVVDPNPSLPEPPYQLVKESVIDPGQLGLGATDSVVVLTKGERDVAILQALSQIPLRFIGLMASHARIAQNVAELSQRGVAPEFVQQLHAPIGLDIGAKTPDELAIAILAEVIAIRNGKTVSGARRT
ncbi:MAG: XdhC family protein [Thermoplasmata archaeon]